MIDLTEFELGVAGEYLVCFDLAMQGIKAFPSDQGLPFDLVMNYRSKLLKVQVKSSGSPRTTNQRGDQPPLYIIGNMKRGRFGKHRYQSCDVDLFALVGISERAVGYVACRDIKGTTQIRSELYRGQYYSESIDERIIEEVRLRSLGASLTEIAKRMNVCRTQVRRDLNGESRLNVRGTYFRDLTLDKAIERLGIAAK